MAKRILVGLVCAGVAGCSTTGTRGNVTPISMADLVQKLGCELIEARDRDRMLPPAWTVTAALSLTRKDDGTLNPGGTFNDALRREGEVVKFAAPIGFNRTTERKVNNAFSFDMAQLRATDCAASHDRTPVVGSIGVAAALREYAGVEKSIASADGRLEGVKFSTIKSDEGAIFTTSTQFDAKLSITAGGAQWVLRHFDGGIGLTASTTATGRLELAFIQPKPVRKLPPPPARVKRKPPAAATTPPVTPATPKAAPLPESMIDRGAQGLELLRRNYGSDRGDDQ